jgi:hypothetical protein
VYSKGQKERGEQNGSIHWQFVIAKERKCRRSVLTNWFPGAHCELTVSEEANRYVHKEETSLGHRWEFGALPHRMNNAQDWQVVWEHAKQGEFDLIPANVRVNSYHNLKKIQMDHMRPVGVEKVVKCLWGGTGLGKSRIAWEEAGLDAYPKAPTTKFWDGYQGQENVVMDEFFGQIEVRF